MSINVGINYWRKFKFDYKIRPFIVTISNGYEINFELFIQYCEKTVSLKLQSKVLVDFLNRQSEIN